MELKRGFGLIAEAAKAPVVPAVIDGLWGSVYSFAGNKYLWKSPRLMPTPVFVVFGTAIPGAESTGWARQAISRPGPSRRSTSGRSCAGISAASACARLAKHPRRIAIVDRTAERREVSAGQLLAVAAALSRRIRATVPEQRVGIVLPPGAGRTSPTSRSPARARCRST